MEADTWTLVKKWLLISAEIALVIAILALLGLIWLPALIGPHPGSVVPGRM